jgi:hypothetical protein
MMPYMQAVTISHENDYIAPAVDTLYGNIDTGSS